MITKFKAALLILIFIAAGASAFSKAAANSIQADTKRSPAVQIELGEPVTVAMASPEIRGWGPYQFPKLTRLPDGRIQVSFNVGADSIKAYGSSAAAAVSEDNGMTWTMLPPEQEDPQGSFYTHGLITLPNGDRLIGMTIRSRPASELKLPEKPFYEQKNFAVYRVDDLPSDLVSNSWMMYRMPAGQTEWQKERSTVHLPGEVRQVSNGTMWFPWLFPLLVNAPDGSLLAVNYTMRRIVDGRYQDKHPITILRSVDNGKSWSLLSEVLYAPDVKADPDADKRMGFLEPYLNFMPDGSAFMLMRTTGGGIGPMYWTRSTDNAKTWSKPAVFDELGVMPEMLTLKNGVTLAVYGRPGLFVRATADPSGLKWDDRITVLDKEKDKTCAYASFVCLDDNTALLAYSNFNLKNAEGKLCKGIQARTVKTRLK